MDKTKVETAGGLVVEPPDKWKLANGSRPAVNYDTPDRKARYAAVVQSAEDRMAEAVDDVIVSLIEKAKSGHLASQREILNRILGVPVQPMEVQSSHVQVEITDEKRELIYRVEQQLIEQSYGRRTLNGVAHSVGETKELTLDSSEAGADTL